MAAGKPPTHPAVWRPWPPATEPSPPSRARLAWAGLAQHLRHPTAGLRALVAHTVPLGLRRRLLAGRPAAPPRCHLGASWEAAQAELAAIPSPRLLVLLRRPEGGWGLAALAPQSTEATLAEALAEVPAVCLPPAPSGTAVAALAPQLQLVAHSPFPIGVVVAPSPAWEEARRWAAALRWPALTADPLTDPPSTLAQAFPTASLAMVTYRHPALTQLALQAVLRFTPWPNLEVIVVDNASPDGTAAACAAVAGQDRRVKILAQAANLGFPRAVNLALAAAKGELIGILNNDVVVTPGWWEGLADELLSHPYLAAVGPSTNAAGNLARQPARYQRLGELVATAWQRAATRRCVRVAQLGFFCVALRARAWRQLGGLDESFGLGYFEDADFCRRARRRGWQLACLRHCFVHHQQSAAFATLADAEVIALYERNRQLYKEMARGGARGR